MVLSAVVAWAGGLATLLGMMGVMIGTAVFASSFQFERVIVEQGVLRRDKAGPLGGREVSFALAEVDVEGRVENGPRGGTSGAVVLLRRGTTTVLLQLAVPAAWREDDRARVHAEVAGFVAALVRLGATRSDATDNPLRA